VAVSAPGKLVAKLTLPFDVIKTIYNGTSEVRLYENEITGVKQIGKRVSAAGHEKAAVFREPTVLQSLSHDNIVPVHTVAIVEGSGAPSPLVVIEMVMPYYPRGSVWDALNKNGERFTVGEAVRLARDGLLGLSELHEGQNLLHRDVKSANVFIDERGRLRVGDLGLAIPMEADGTAEAFQGSQLYTAPEILTARRVDRRTDVYGFGLILLELLQGPFPYGEYTRDQVWDRLKVGRRPIKDAHLRFKPHVAPQLRRAVNKAIARNPDDRFANAREMIASLDDASFVDWRVVVDDTDAQQWEGAVAGKADAEYRIIATRYRRADAWKLVAEKKCATRWQRCGVDDQRVPGLDASDAIAFFDQVVRHSTSR
jgi:serine/threonine protein kinase